MEQSLIDFIGHARHKGMDHATVRVLLLSAGWKEKDVARAMAAEGLDIPVPEPPGAGGPREVFMHLLTFTLLYITVISLIFLFFEYLNRLYPDPAKAEYFSEEYSLSTIRWSLSTLIVAAPLFVALQRHLVREMRTRPEKDRGSVRRWLTWLTLFVASMTGVFNLVTLIFYFLEGELSTRFVLKVAVLFTITGAVFTYYVMSLRAHHGEAS
jgi:hypothetical protein